MNLKIESRAYTKPRIKITVSAHATKLKIPMGLDGAFADRLNAFALQIATTCQQCPAGTRTMHGTIGLDEVTGKMQVHMVGRCGELDIKEA